METMIYKYIVIIIFVITGYIQSRKIEKLQKQCAILLENDNEFQNFIINLINEESNTTICIKTINAKYNIGILNSKLLFDKFKNNIEN